MSTDETQGTLLRQTLMSVDEVFVYKIPPLTTSGGHRADAWNLANPLATCGFQVERRNNELFLIFTSENHTKIFALAKYLHKTSVEPVVDSSRYFVTQLWSNDPAQKRRTAFIGFGFRERDNALDLLQSLQGFQRSIQREHDAKAMIDKAASNVMPTLKAGEKMHISFGSKKKSTIVKGGGKRPSQSGDGPKKPFLLKKPPPGGNPAPTVAPQQQQRQAQTQPETATSAASEGADGGGNADGGDDDENDVDWGDF
mmetsp:Transcript_17011/g.47094  ORF Transcript_17011/g.47094 Transcript_17011/m.47094 type:complete len:255 (-) Transcript_17011:750-1514(-)|eukprot:CAMPEP_0198135096 /NCGR_PEP_ID=MMETSP1442-20131203/60412_1 /TAXON_ID= /ORGANISM="Craspedostauros australis, Strain CCMP3328" /LENGTH=254 /DNA_ID=CAMNT_0043796257 /DNA_START=595 /DNA_END=1359 /DNA_ORIENTATION=-